MKVHELLSAPDRWTQGAAARRVDESCTDPRDPEAVSWCLAGAIMRCYDNPGEHWFVVEKVTEELSTSCILAWNDHQGRTWKEVIELAQRVDI